METAFSRRNASGDQTLLDETVLLDFDAVGFDAVLQFTKISHVSSPSPLRSTKRIIVVGIALLDEARVVGESGNVMLGKVAKHGVDARRTLVQAGTEQIGRASGRERVCP